METRPTIGREIDEINQQILHMGTLVEESLAKAISSLVAQNVENAQKVIENDAIVNTMEIEIQDICISAIARHQPVAGDLRRLMTGLKVIAQLERMGDHSVHIGKAAKRLSEEQLMKPLVDIPRMGEVCCRMVREVLTAFVNNNSQQAIAVAKLDEEVDNLHQQVLREIFTFMVENTKFTNQSINLLFVSRFLERFGDHATNISEWIVYSETGKHAELNT